METSVQLYSTLHEEIESLKEFLAKAELRYKGKISCECSVDPDVEKGVIIPKMLIRIFIENAINHHLLEKPEGGKVETSVHRSNLGVLIMITDNGTSLKDAPILAKYREEKLRLLDDFLLYFNTKNPHYINYHILDRGIEEPGRSGSRVLITIKY